MKEKIKKILRWLYWHAPIITTRKQQEEAKNLNQRLYKIRVTPAIHSLQELRKNTWDVKNNFEDIKTSQKYQMMMLQKFSLMQTAESDLIRGCKK